MFDLGQTLGDQRSKIDCVGHEFSASARQNGRTIQKASAMLRYVPSALEVVVLVSASLIPDDARARRSGGGGFRAGVGFTEAE